MNTRDRLDAFVMAVMPKFMGFGGYPRQSIEEAAESCVKAAQTVMAVVDKVEPPETSMTFSVSPPGPMPTTAGTVGGKVIDLGEGQTIGVTTLQPLKPNEVLDRPVSSLDLSVRARKALKHLEVKTLRDLTKITRKELGDVWGVGEWTIAEIAVEMKKLGLSLARTSEPLSGNLATLKGVSPDG